MKRTIILVCLAALLALGASEAQAVEHPTTYILCGNAADYSGLAKPRDCFLNFATDGRTSLSLAESANPQRLTWRHWGSNVATAHGVDRTKTYDPWTHVTVTAFRRVSCGGTYLYTRVRVNYSNGYRHTWTMMGCSYIPGE